MRRVPWSPAGARLGVLLVLRCCCFLVAAADASPRWRCDRCRSAPTAQTTYLNPRSHARRRYGTKKVVSEAGGAPPAPAEDQAAIQMQQLPADPFDQEPAEAPAGAAAGAAAAVAVAAAAAAAAAADAPSAPPLHLAVDALAPAAEKPVAAAPVEVDAVAALLKGNEKLLSQKVSSRHTCTCSSSSSSSSSSSQHTLTLSPYIQKLPPKKPPQELDVVRALLAEGQDHLFASWPAPGSEDAGKRRLAAQLAALDASYHGGLVAYIRNAKQLLNDSKEGAWV